VSLGNDVVDLADPETRLCGLHPRFEERVFTPAERALLASSGDRRHLLHWALWAAKESAYKALARLSPGTVFAPRAFEVELPAPPSGDAVARGRVRRGAESFALEVCLRSGALHALAARETGASGAAPPLWAVALAGGEPGAAVRRLAARDVSAALAPAAGPVRICGRPPVAVGEAGPLDVLVSLSHHGRFVAFAVAASGGPEVPVNARRRPPGRSASSSLWSDTGSSRQP